ncbi:hypothetical protein Ddye_020580 [Dipteronia dyeriana]|uniref:Beta-galactosidase n=1 Tax=Dipteronia dyeriana TaxID=168575 RepID=A0AAD9U120_9ROSI|nr:hypothetical protein Ddye_020580 [Dipteronia dyeriana]
MAISLGTGVPWVMCKQDDAPDPVINTCNGFYCENFIPNKGYKPKIWTEAWIGCTMEELILAGQPEVLSLRQAMIMMLLSTNLDYQELRDLHKAIKLCEYALVSTDPTVTSLGRTEEVNFSDE